MTYTKAPNSLFSPFLAMAEAGAQSLSHLGEITAKAATGHYSAQDVPSDLRVCVERAEKTWQEIFTWLESMLDPPAPSKPEPPKSGPPKSGPGPIWTATVLLTTKDRPLTLRTDGFRRIGGGQPILADRVTFSPSVILERTITSFVITVDLSGLDTGIFEGQVTSVEHHLVPVCQTVMPAF